MGMKGYFLSLDATLAAILLLGGVTLLSILFVNQENLQQIEPVSEGMATAITSMRLADANNTYLDELIAAKVIENTNRTLMEEVGRLWAENKTQEAKGLVRNMTEGMVPENYGVGVYINGEALYERNTTREPVSLVSTKRLISGIAKDKPIDGFSSRVHITDFESRTTRSFSYFGGFIGQGNLSQRLMLPNNVSEILSAYFEAAVSNNFTLHINGQFAGYYTVGSAGGGPFLADKWDINETYLGLIQAGENTLNISFNQSGIGFVGGGFFRVTYNTPELNETSIMFETAENQTQREWFPSVNGFVNIFSSFYVPGKINTMTGQLHYKSNLTTFLTIGAQTVLSNNSPGEYIINFTNTQLDALLDYVLLSETTVPVRLASTTNNITLTQQVGTADVMLVNDLSGSMQWCAQDGCDTLDGFLDFNSCGSFRIYWHTDAARCDNDDENYNLITTGAPVCSERWHSSCLAGDIPKIGIARNASKEFVNSVLNSTGNRMGLVEYSDDFNRVRSGSSWITPFPDGIVGNETLTNDNVTLLNHISTYMADTYWGTCICCGVVRAHQILQAKSGAGRAATMVVMSDGEATDTCASIGTGNAKNDAIQAAQNACSQDNISVFTVGFGADVDPVTLQAMTCNNGTYFNASDVNALIDAYNQIAEQIVTISFQEQEITIAGDATNASSILYDDSYLEFNYTPTSTIPFGRIPFTLESDRFGNQGSDGVLTVPGNISIERATATSYSDDYWTDNVTVSNSNGEWLVFDLADYASNYLALGDPFVVNIPENILISANNVHISTGVSPQNATGGSADNRVVYVIGAPNAVPYGPIFPSFTGCSWELIFEDDTTAIIPVPSSYAGSKECFVSNASYDSNDAVDDAAYRLLSIYDFDGNGKLDIKFSSDNIDITSITQRDVPSLWGPSVFEVRIWR